MRRPLVVTSLLLLGLVVATAMNTDSSLSTSGSTATLRLPQGDDVKPHQVDVRGTEQKKPIGNEVGQQPHAPQHDTVVTGKQTGHQQQQKNKVDPQQALSQLQKLRDEVLSTEETYVDTLDRACGKKKARHIVNFINSKRAQQPARQLIGRLLAIECNMKSEGKTIINSLKEISKSKDANEFVPKTFELLANHLTNNVDSYVQYKILYEQWQRAKEHNELTQAFQQLKNEDSQRSNKKKRQVALDSILIAIIQRTPRYKMFAEALLKNAEDAELEPSKLESAKDSVNTIRNMLNQIEQSDEYNTQVVEEKKPGSKPWQKLKDIFSFNKSKQKVASKPEDNDAGAVDDDADGDDDTDASDDDDDDAADE